MALVALLANPLLAMFGFKIIRVYLGRWMGPPLRRIAIPCGWRLARRSEWADLPDDATELDRFLAARVER